MNKLGAKEGLAADRGGSPAVAEKLKKYEVPPVGSRPFETLSQLAHSVRSAGTAGRRWTEALFKPEGDPTVVQGLSADSGLSTNPHKCAFRLIEIIC